jgi:transcriptional regulator with XRE-family HTH domain
MRPVRAFMIRADRDAFPETPVGLFTALKKPVNSNFIHAFIRHYNIHSMYTQTRVFKSTMYILFMSIGENIRKLRKAKGLTQAELGEKIGTRQKVIADYENGISKPPRDRLLSLSKFFDLPVEKIIGKNDAATLPEFPAEPKIHGNKRTAKLIDAFEKLSETEQRVILNQTQALAEKRKNDKEDSE